MTVRALSHSFVSAQMRTVVETQLTKTRTTELCKTVAVAGTS